MASLKQVFASPSVIGAITIAAALIVGPPATAISQIGIRAEGYSGGIGIRLIDGPANESDLPVSPHIADTVTPGTTITRRVEVSNTTTSPHSVALYAAAATINDGSFIGAAGRTGNELSSWTTVEKPAVGLPAESAVTSTVTIAVPDDAPLGEMYAVVWAEVGTPDAGKSSMAKRVGIKMYVDISSNGSHPASFAVDTVTAQRGNDGKSVILAQVRNTGGRALDFSGALKLSSITGELRAGPFPAQSGTTLAPGQSGPVTFPATGDLADGPWNVALDMVSGHMRESYQAQITFPKEPGSSPTSPASHDSPMIGWVIGALIALVCLAALALLLILLRGRTPDGAPN
jgi:hypothetical protein